jgi:hypothetical protein
MAYEMKDFSGTLFKEVDKKNERGPDYTGDCMIDGTVYRMAAWIKEGQSGRKFMSLNFQPKDQPVAKPAPAKRRPVEDEDDVPF